MQETALAISSEPQDLALPDREQPAAALAEILATGNLAKLTNEQRVAHYLNLCRSLGLNPASRPFDWIEFYDPQTKAKKLQLYLNGGGAAQLRRLHQISCWFTRRDNEDGMRVVEV